MGIDVTLVESINIEWRGKFWCRRPVLTIIYSEVFGSKDKPQEFDLIDCSIFTLTGVKGGKIGFVARPDTPGDGHGT